MKIRVKVRPQSKQAKVEKLGEGYYEVFVKEPAKENKANFAVLEALAQYFDVPISGIRLVMGRTSKEKVFEIDN